VSVSSTFSPTAQHRQKSPEVTLLSEDSVYFYIHSALLLDASENGFHAMLPISPADDGEPRVLSVSEPSAVLNDVILHAIYALSCAHFSPPFDTLVHVVDAMPAYGISPKLAILPSTPLFALLFTHAPLHPLDLYTLAAHHDMLALAVPTSSHLLSFALPTLLDAIVVRMGPVYLKRQAPSIHFLFYNQPRPRLFFLHLGRAAALKRLLLPPPDAHPPTCSCAAHSQGALRIEWALAAAQLAWDARPDLSTNTLEATFLLLAACSPCDLCKSAFEARVRGLVVEWSNKYQGVLCPEPPCKLFNPAFSARYDER
ncbi:hypothetical protein B0H17DRAFT_945301, partial [Mycena rosella]